MRVQSAQLHRYLTDGLWLQLAARANQAMATRVTGLCDLGVQPLDELRVNMAFLELPPAVIDRLLADDVLFAGWATRRSGSSPASRPPTPTSPTSCTGFHRRLRQTDAMRRVLPHLAGVVAVGLLLSITACSGSDSEGDPAAGPTVAPAAEPVGTKTFDDLDANHVDTPVDYPQTPPVGGNHAPAWQTCAFYDAVIPSERGVHSMEHGAVWITFSPNLAAAEVEVLKALQDAGKEVLVSKFEGLPSPIVASAWGKQLQVQTADDPALAEFVRYFDDGPQTPETGTPCAKGISETT
jgi:hypothetical protein